jgi:hypothetical protein
MGLSQPYGFTSGQNIAATAGLMGLQAGNYAPGNFSYDKIAPETYQTQNMQGAQTGWQPNLQDYQIGAPDQFGQQQANQYMSPYYQNVVDVQKQEATRDAQKGQLAQNLNAAKQGTYGGARQLLATTERERNLGQQLGSIQATGTQAAYENAQQQFERDRAAGLGVAGQNLQARLGTQQLGATTGLQANLANLSNEQQAAVNNQAAYLQTQGLNANQAMQAALANQSAGLQTQQMAEQSRQFGANLGLQGLNTAVAGGQATVQGASAAQASDLARLGAQMGYGDKQQALDQAKKDVDYADFLRQRDQPLENLSYYSNIIHGLPVTPNTTSTTYAPPPSALSQVAGAGLTALSAYNMGR